MAWITEILPLSLLLLIARSHVAEGFGHHTPKGELYFAMAFSVFVETLNLRIRGRSAHPLHLRGPRLGEEG